MKKFFSFILILSCLSFLPKQETIRWEKGEPLEWSNFKARAPKLSGYEALSAVGISLGFNMQGDDVSIEVFSFFIPQKSWTKDRKSQYLLNHEQMHFDISEIHARKMRKACMEAKWSAKSIQNKLNDMLEKFTDAEDKMQEKYDRETNHSIVKSKQEEWNVFIQNELQKLEPYSSTHIQITLD